MIQQTIKVVVRLACQCWYMLGTLTSAVSPPCLKSSKSYRVQQADLAIPTNINSASLRRSAGLALVTAARHSLGSAVIGTFSESEIMLSSTHSALDLSLNAARANESVRAAVHIGATIPETESVMNKPYNPAISSVLKPAELPIYCKMKITLRM